MKIEECRRLAKLEETNKHRKIERLHGLEQDLTVYKHRARKPLPMKSVVG